MKVNHWVETTEQEASDLYMHAITIAKASYPTVEEQDMAILEAMPHFKAALDDLVSQAFKLGYAKKHKAKNDETVV